MLRLSPELAENRLLRGTAFNVARSFSASHPDAAAASVYTSYSSLGSLALEALQSTSGICYPTVPVVSLGDPLDYCERIENCRVCGCHSQETI